MLNKVLNLGVAVSLLACSNDVIAGIDTFECIVQSVHEVSSAGNIVTETAHLKGQIGNSFSVERSTGDIRGSYFLSNRGSESVKVINEPEEGSYYVIFESFGPYKMVGYLHIGNDNDSINKPFTYTIAGKGIYSGYCI